MLANVLRNTYLKALRLPTFLRNYRLFAEVTAQVNHGYDHFLLALVKHGMAQREQNHIARYIKAARFPVLKEQADFDFFWIFRPNMQQVQELTQRAISKEPNQSAFRQLGPGLRR